MLDIRERIRDNAAMRASLSSLALLLLLTFAGCAESPAQPAPDAGLPDATSGPVRRKSLPLSFDPNGLFWHAASHTLYIADDGGNQILKWTDAGNLEPVAQLPAAPTGDPGLGQLVVTADGTIVVPRFGGGTAGDVVYVKPDGTASVVPGLAPERRRIGLTVAEDGTLYDSFFLKMGTGRIGTVAKLSLQAGETDVLTTLQKPVGVLAVGTALYVSDQDLGQLLRAPVSNPTAPAVFATLPSPDLLALGPGGSIFTGGLQGGVRRISATGEVTLFQDGLKQPRGVAWDPAAGRLFIANHDGDPTDGTAHTLEIVPVD